VKYEGIGGLFGGVFPAILAAIPFEQGVVFLYEFFKKYDSHSSELTNRMICSFLELFVFLSFLFVSKTKLNSDAGILSSVIAQTVSYPFDLVKKRLQVTSQKQTNKQTNKQKIAIKNMKRNEIVVRENQTEKLKIIEETRELNQRNRRIRHLVS
jgi:hypothetical protein